MGQNIANVAARFADTPIKEIQVDGVGIPIRGSGYVEMGGQTMQIAFNFGSAAHRALATATKFVNQPGASKAAKRAWIDATYAVEVAEALALIPIARNWKQVAAARRNAIARHIRNTERELLAAGAGKHSFQKIQISIGAEFNVAAYCWEDRGADAAWQRHRDNLYNGSRKPQRRPAAAAVPSDHCLPSGVHDSARPTPAPDNNGYTGSGRFAAGVNECLSLTGCYSPNADGAFSLKEPGFLNNDLPADVGNVARELKKWVGAATFYYGPHNLTPDAYNPITVLERAAALQTGTTNYIAWRDGSHQSDDTACRGVFNAVYTSVTLHHGFGINIRRNIPAVDNYNSVRGAIVAGQQWALNANPPPPVQALLDACVIITNNAANGKTYEVVNPDDKPWALGAAVVYAHDRIGFNALVKK